jgi:hypothetical protein
VAQEGATEEFKDAFQAFVYSKEENNEMKRFLEGDKKMQEEFERQKQEGRVVDEKDFIANNKRVADQFDEYKTKNIEEINLRKFVNANLELKQMYENFAGSVSDGPAPTYQQFMSQNAKARDIYEREVVFNPEHQLNVEKFLLANKDIRREIEAKLDKDADIKDILGLLKTDLNFKQGFDTFVKKQEEDTKLNKFIESNPELKSKIQKLMKTNPKLDRKKFVEENNKAEYENFSKKEERKMEAQKFLNSNQDAKAKFDKLKRQYSNANLEDFIEQNTDIKANFELFKKTEAKEKEFVDFLRQNPELEKQYKDQVKKDGRLTVKDYMKKADSKTLERFNKYAKAREEDRARVSKRTSNNAKNAGQAYKELLSSGVSPMEAFARQNSEVQKRFLELKQKNPTTKMTFEQFVQEQVNNPDVQKDFQRLVYEAEAENDCKAFLENNKDLFEEFERQKQEGRVVDEKDFIANNKRVADQFDEYKTKNIEEINLRKFVNANLELKQMYENFAGSVSDGPAPTYQQFMSQNAKARDIYEREVVFNPEHQLNVEKFLLANKDIRREIEAKLDKDADIKDILGLLKTDLNFKQGFDTFVKKQEEDTKLNKFIESNPELKSKIQKLMKTNPKLDRKKFVEENNKAEYENFSKKEERKMEAQKFLNSNQDAKAKFDKLKRQYSNANLEDFIEQNTDIKANFELFKKTEAKEKEFVDFLRQNPELEKQYKDQVKKDGRLTVKDYMKKADSKTLERFNKYAKAREEDRARVSKRTSNNAKNAGQAYKELLSSGVSPMEAFARQNSEVQKRFLELKQKNPTTKMTFEQFVQEQVNNPDVQKDFQRLVYEAEAENDCKAFLENNKDLFEEFERQKQEGRVVDEKDFIANNKRVADQFDEYKTKNIEEINLRKFVNANLELKQMYENFAGSVSDGPAPTYQQFMSQNAKARDIYEREVVFNPEHQLNVEKFLLANKDIRREIEAKLDKDADIKDILGLLKTDLNFKQGFDTFVKKQEEDTKLNKFIESNPELKSKIQKLMKTNPKLDRKKFVEENNKAEYENFSSQQDKSIAMKQYLETNLVAKAKFEQLQRQYSKASLEDFFESNPELKAELKAYNEDKQESKLMEEFILSEPQLLKQFEEARKQRSDLTAQQFFKTSQPSIARKLKNYKTSLEKQCILKNFLLSNEELRQQYEEKRKLNPRLTPEQFLKESNSVLKQYQDFVEKTESDKMVERYLKQNKEMEKKYSDFKSKNQEATFEEFLKTTPQTVQERFTNFVKSEELASEYLKIVEEDPLLKARLQRATDSNPDLNLLEILVKDSNLKEEIEKAQSKKIDQEYQFEAFLGENPAEKGLFETYRIINHNASVQDFLSENEEIRAKFRLHANQEAKMRENFDQFLAADKNNSKAFEAFVGNAKQNNQLLGNIIDQIPRLKSKYEHYLKNNAKSQHNYEKFVTGNPKFLKEFQALKRSQNDLTWKQFVEENPNVKQEFEKNVKDALANDSSALDGYFKNDGDAKKEVLQLISKNPNLIFKDFVASSEAVKGKYMAFVKTKPVDAPKVTVTKRFLESSAKTKEEFKKFVESTDLVENSNVFRAFVNRDFLLKKEFVEFAKNDVETKKNYEDFKKKTKNSSLTLDQFVKNNLFTNAKLNKRFMAANSELKKDFVKFVSNDEEAVQEFIKTSQRAAKEYSEFINNNKTAKLNYELFCLKNPEKVITLEEFVLDNPDAMRAELRSEVYQAFADSNPEILARFQDFVQTHPNEDVTLEKFISSDADLRLRLEDFATETAVQEIEEMAQFKNQGEAYNNAVDGFISQREEEVLKLLEKDQKLKSQVLAAQKKNPKLSLSKILAQNPGLNKQVKDLVKNDQTVFKTLLKEDKKLQQKFSEFRETKEREQLEFKKFIRENQAVQNLFASLAEKDPGVTMDQFVRQAMASSEIKEMYLREAIYDHQSARSYQDFLLNSPDVRKGYDTLMKTGGPDSHMTFEEYVEQAKHSEAIISKYYDHVKSLPLQANHYHKLIDSNRNVKRKFMQFLEQKAIRMCS